ncbi:putative esterase [Gluconobacter morbifer G707]|uniref:Putative esterase n=2 Tax=Gluconobacter TaxID=441 RepID=G6XHJ1_9PROT|nr:putative esterase [Gluconobacter morbifer G707]
MAFQAQAGCGAPGPGEQPAPNLSNANQPFFIDTTHLNGATHPPTRDPHSPNYPVAQDLADGVLPPVDRNGNFVLGPTHDLPFEFTEAASVPHGRVTSFTLRSDQSILFSPGIIRDDGARCPDGSPFAPYALQHDPSSLQLHNSHPGPWSRQIDVYVPVQYRAGAAAPFLVFGDGGSDGVYPGRDLFAILDVLISQHRLPPLIAIGIGAGGQDAQGSERGREYDTASGTYADWVEQEVLPRVERQASVKLTHDPDGRATMGVSSSGAAAFSMAWFRPQLYHRVLAYSPTLTNQQWPHDPRLPGGAWQFHDAWAGNPKASGNEAGAALVPNAPRKPIRFWFEAGDQDLFYPGGLMPDGMHDWVLASEDMARVFAAKGYDYQFVFSRNAGHVDGPTIEQTLPEALVWTWQGYKNQP